MIEKLGKISNVKLGFVGYQNVQLGVQFTLEGEDWGTSHTIVGGWGHVDEEDLKKPKASYEWTHEGRILKLGECFWKLRNILKDAKVDDIKGLEGKPVRVFFDSELGPNHGFEILKAVL